MTPPTNAEAAVVDASALAAVLFGEPDAERLVQRLGGRRLLAPTLLPYELASVCRKKIDRHPGRRTALRAALGLWPRMEVRQVDVPPEELVETAQRSGLTAYDAAYLWLARTLECELVTLDASLATAARR